MPLLLLGQRAERPRQFGLPEETSHGRDRGAVALQIDAGSAG